MVPSTATPATATIVYDLDDDNVKAHPALNEQYTLYLDPNGYVLGFVQETGSTQYLYVKDSDRGAA